MQFDISNIPFSRYGSYFVISQGGEDESIYIRDLHGGDEAPSYLYKLSVLGLTVDQLEIIATPTKLRILQKNTDKEISFVLGNESTLHILMKGLALRMDTVSGKYDSLVEFSKHQWEHTLYSKNQRMLFTCVKGEAKVLGTWALIGSKDAAIICNENCRETYMVIENYKTVWTSKKYEPIETVETEVSKAYDEWQKSMPQSVKNYKEQTELASYLLWTNFVKAQGIMKYDALYCSKNWMYNIWSWDNCFMAIALSDRHPRHGYEQLRAFYHLQDQSGCYPDYTNDCFAAYSCCKPPIHAWAYKKMREQNETYFSNQERLRESFDSFLLVTQYWLNHRRKSPNRLPEYNHGNDSGWDNSSAFHQGVPIESPDLTAYLIRQLDILSSMARELGDEDKARELLEVADELYAKLIQRHFDGRKFFAIHVPSDKKIEEGDTLLMYLPIVIGYRMPKNMLDQLVTDMIERFEGTYGLCTESPKSPLYKEGGYWLGPIWAPVSYILIDALREHGYVRIAKRLAYKFCELTKLGNMAENFNAFTGEGYDDPAFSWTSSVFLQLLKEYPDFR